MSYDQFFKQAKKNTTKGAKVKTNGSSESGDQYSAAEAFLQQELAQRSVKTTQRKAQSKSRASQLRANQVKSRKKQKLASNQGSKTRNKQSTSKKWLTKREMNLALGSLCFVGFLASLFVFVSPEEVFTKISKIKVGTFSKASAQASEKSSESKGKDVEKSSLDNMNKPQAKVPDVKSWSNEELSFFANLNNRKTQLDQREQELKKLEEELQKKQVELDKKISELEKMRANIAEVLKEKVTEDQKRLDKLVQVYQNMKPVNAAAILATVDESLAIEILGKMKKREAAAILNFVEPKKARRLSERFTGYSKK